MNNPFSLPPHPDAQKAAAQVIENVHAYMRAHPDSELHQCGKMFGVLVYPGGFIAAFSAKLDGSYFHEGFVPPVYDMTEPPVGTTKEESQRLQRLLFAGYNLLNAQGESKNLLDIFASEKPILSKEEFFDKSPISNNQSPVSLPPSGAGECCAPKLLQYAFLHGLTPVALAEFWVGAPSKTEVRTEGTFYTPCSGRCRPILRHMLRGLTLDPDPQTSHALELCRQMETLYEDEYLIVVNKPSGLLSVPGKTDEPSVETFFHLPPFNFHFIKASHRLDQDTSGLLVLARTPEAYKTLQACFQRRDILKRYEALLRPNNPSPITALQSEGTISLPLLPDPYDRPRQMVDLEHGKTAVTRYAVRERRPDGTVFVDFYPLTGRTHQLRVHAAHPDGLNAPILGDRLYASTTNGQSPTTNDHLRLFLHASEIAFPHPVTQQEMHFCIPSCF